MSLADDIAASADELSKSAPAATSSLADNIAAAHASNLQDRQQASAPTQYSPLGSDYENAAAGAGKAVSDLGRGAGQLLRSGLSYSSRGEAISNGLGLPTRADIDESEKRDAALMGTKAGAGGNIAGNIASFMVPMGLAARAGVPLASMLYNPSTYTAAASAGAVNGALQPVGTEDSRGKNMMVGSVAGLAGNAAVNAIGRAAQPIKNTLSTAAEKSLEVLRNAGVPIDAAQASGSSLLNSIKSSFSDNPFTRGAQHEAASAQKSAYNQAVLKTIGEDATAGTSEVMGAADKRIGGVFENILNRNNIKINDSHLDKLGSIQQSALDDQAGPVSNLVNRLMNHIQADGTVSGQDIYKIKRSLDNHASSIDPALSDNAKALRTMVMDTIHESLPPADQAAFAEARQQFGNMKKIEPALDKAGTGDISPSLLANEFSKKANRQISMYGKGDQTLVNLAQSGKQILGDKLPNSGTAARSLMQMALPLTAGVLSGGADGYNGDYTGALTKAAMGAGAMIVAPKLAQRFINSQGANGYVTQGLKNSPLRDLLTLPENKSMVGGALRRLPGAYESSPQTLQLSGMADSKQ